MKSHHETRRGFIGHGFLKAVGGVLTVSAVLGSAPVMAAEVSISGDATTIFRARTTVDRRDTYPVYEYLRMNASGNNSDGSAISFFLGAWGRLDLGDRTTDRRTDGDLPYAYLSYRGAKNNTVVNLGRQFITDGVAMERIDGIYLRNDFAWGIGASAFVGKSVLTEPDAKGGDVSYGARVSHTVPKYYTIGASVLKSDLEDGSRYREEAGLDLWVHPAKQFDLVGRSSYNGITQGWMEHAYTMSIIPADPVRISLDVSNINYRDYFYNMTTNVFRLFNGVGGVIDPDEVLTSGGVAVSWTPMKNVTLAADYKHYAYEIAGEADYYGGNLSYALPDSLAAGIGLHRMESTQGRLRYTETRLFASKKLGKATLAGDFHNVWYDNAINGLRNSYIVTGAAGYDVTPKLRLGADVEYARTPDFDSEVRGLFKITYAFDAKLGAEGGKGAK